MDVFDSTSTCSSALQPTHTCVPWRLPPCKSDNTWLCLSHCVCPQSHTDLADTMLNKKKGPRKPSKSVSSSFAGSPEAAEEEHKINLLDSGAVKRELDEGAIRVNSQPFFKAQQGDVNCFTVYIRQPCCLAVYRLLKELDCKKTTMSVMSRFCWVS